SGSRGSSGSTPKRSTTSSAGTASRSAAAGPPPSERLRRERRWDGRDDGLGCDDDVQVRESLVEALRAESFDVDTADRAVDAIQKVMRARYHAVVLDLKLPGLGGLDAIAILRRFDER